MEMLSQFLSCRYCPRRASTSNPTCLSGVTSCHGIKMNRDMQNLTNCRFLASYVQQMSGSCPPRNGMAQAPSVTQPMKLLGPIRTSAGLEQELRGSTNERRERVVEQLKPCFVAIFTLDHTALPSSEDTGRAIAGSLHYLRCSGLTRGSNGLHWAWRSFFLWLFLNATDLVYPGYSGRFFSLREQGHRAC